MLVILVFNDREVQNRIIQLERRYGAEELRRAANYLNEHCRSRSLSQMHVELLRQLKDTHASINQVMLDAIAIAQQVSGQGGSQEGIEYVIAGETNLMGLGDLSSVDKLKRLFEAFTEKRDILHLLDQSLRAEGVQIFIGHESGYQILDDCSIVTAPYSTGEGVAGVLGRDRPHPDGLRTGHSDRRYHGKTSGHGLEFAPLTPMQRWSSRGSSYYAH